jgi:hypothetical protein
MPNFTPKLAAVGQTRLSRKDQITMSKLWTVALAVVTLGAVGTSAYGESASGALKASNEETLGSLATALSPQFSAGQPQLGAESSGVSVKSNWADASSSRVDALRTVPAGVNVGSSNTPAGGTSDKAEADGSLMRYANVFAGAPTVSLSPFDAAAPGLAQLDLRAYVTGSSIPEIGAPPRR